MRIAVHTIVLILLAAAAMQTWLVDGLVTPCRITGSSMAETLLGVHREVVCGDCGYCFSYGVESSPPVRAVCPNCGYAANNVESAPDQDGDRVLIDRAAFSIRAPRRWEVAAFRRRSSANQILVKRIVGLPGESIEIRYGDVFADGRIQRKSVAQQRAMAVLVYDADFQPTYEPTPPPRWRPERSDSRWNAADGCFTHVAAADDERIDWLAYHHWRRLATGDAGASAVTDICGYDQSQPRREEDVQAVTDLMLSFRLGPVSGRGALLIRMSDGSRGFQMRLQFQGHAMECAAACLQAAPGQPVTLGTAGEQPVAHCTVPASNAERLVEMSLIDQQFLLAVDGRTLMVWPYERPEPLQPPLTSPLAMGAEGVSVSIRSLRVYRDTYYTQPIGPPGREPGNRPVRLATDEYFVLGDNSPTSEDSRTWPEPRAADAKLLVGKPLVAIPSIWLSFGGRRHFQVPNPLQIRYIR